LSSSPISAYRKAVIALQRITKDGGAEGIEISCSRTCSAFSICPRITVVADLCCKDLRPLREGGRCVLSFLVGLKGGVKLAPEGSQEPEADQVRHIPGFEEMGLLEVRGRAVQISGPLVESAQLPKRVGVFRNLNCQNHNIRGQELRT